MFISKLAKIDSISNFSCLNSRTESLDEQKGKGGKGFFPEYYGVCSIRSSNFNVQKASSKIQNLLKFMDSDFCKVVRIKKGRELAISDSGKKLPTFEFLFSLQKITLLIRSFK